MQNYMIQESLQHHLRVTRAQEQPLADRKEAQQDYSNLLNVPEHFIRHCDEVERGDWGEYLYHQARDVLFNKRMNRESWIGQMIALYAFNCPAREARKAWNNMDKSNQLQLSEMFVNWLNNLEH